MDWQPMETAPRDGSWVMLLGGSLDKYAEVAPPATVARYEGLHPRYGEEWRYASYDSGEYGRVSEPRGWMPLPQSREGKTDG